MKVQVNQVQKQVQSRFKRGDIIITGHGTIVILSEDFNPARDRLYSGTILVDTWFDREGQHHEGLRVSSGVVSLFTGTITLSN